MKYITDDNYEELVTNNKYVVIDFYADWCGPCKMYGPIFEKVADNYQNALFVKCDVDKNPNTAIRFNVQSIPTTVIIHNKEDITVQQGAMMEPQLSQLLEKKLNKGE